VYPFADPNALAVSPDETRAYSGEGASIAVLDVAVLPLTEASVLARVPVEASILALACTETRLFVAGGRFGLLVSERESLGAPWRTIDDVPDKPCMDVVVESGRVSALFGAAGASELRVYAEGSLEPVGRLALDDGTALAIDVEDALAAVALGPGGLVLLDLSGDRPIVLARADRAAFATAEPDGGAWASVRDVAIVSGDVFAAVDGAGLARVCAHAPGEPLTIALTPIGVAGKRNYASRVDARGGLVVVGSHGAPVAVQDGAPYHALGWIDHDLKVGGVASDSYARGAGEALSVFLDRDHVLEPRTTARSEGGWRSLVLGRERLYEQHIGTGLRIRALRGSDGPERAAPASANDEPPTVLATRTPLGFPAVDGVVSLVDPSLILFGTDPAGSRPAGLLRLSADGLAVVPGTVDRPLGLTAGAQWVDAEHGDEWLVAGFDRGWSLYRIDVTAPARSRRWTLVAPEGPDGTRGHDYFFSAIAGDVLFLSRSSSRFGLLGVSAGALTAAARATRTPRLELDPLFVARTHENGVRARSRTWRLAPYDAPDGRLVVAVAQGFESDPAHPDTDRATLALYDVTGAADGVVRLVGIARGLEPDGLAVALDVAALGERHYAFVADLTHGVLVVDVTNPEAPVHVADWRTPVHPFDGRREHVIDLAVERLGPSLDVWLACGRLGLVRLAATIAEDGALQLVERQRIETPGFAEGVFVVADRAGAGGRRVLVGDQKCGLRVYR
jgi:hypothetical protein